MPLLLESPSSLATLGILMTGDAAADGGDDLEDGAEFVSRDASVFSGCYVLLSTGERACVNLVAFVDADKRGIRV